MWLIVQSDLYWKQNWAAMTDLTKSSLLWKPSRTTMLAYAKTKIELSRPIWLVAVYDENHTWQQRDQSYRCNQHRKRN